MNGQLLTIGLLVTFATALSAHEGGIVQRVVPDSAAVAAGLRAGDRILRIADRPLATHDDLREILEAHRPGDTVPVVVERDGSTRTLELSFGARPDGGVAIGIAVALAPAGGAEDPESGAARCLAWIERTYRVEAALAELRLDRARDLATIRQCVERDAGLMTTENAVRFCDNIFKVHCSASDVLAEIGETSIARCADSLAATLGPRPERAKIWRTRVEPALFEGYVREGEFPDAAACRATLLERCGTNLDAAVAAATLTDAQETFVACCSAGASERSACANVGAPRGGTPCDASAICLDRETAAWIHCSVLD